MKTKHAITILPKRSEKYDSKDIRIGERGFGYLGDAKSLGLIRCPSCTTEIYGPSVRYGECESCGYNLYDEFKEQYPEIEVNNPSDK